MPFVMYSEKNSKKMQCFLSILVFSIGTVNSARKQLSWLGANQLLIRQGDHGIHSSSALAELNEKIYVFGGSASNGNRG